MNVYRYCAAMTIAIAWTRGCSPNEELVFVTDSRLSGDGCTFDACPKVQSLPRPDCAIAFAGETGHAYPMMLQLSLAIESHRPLKRSELDLPIVRSHAKKIFDTMGATIRSGILPSSTSDEFPKAEFLFGGYAWEKKKFELWKMHFDPSIRKFTARPAKWVGYSTQLGRPRLTEANTKIEPFGLIAFAGDQAPLAIERFKQLIAARSSEHARTPLNWEPLEIVRDMLRDPQRAHTIGGPPQIMKVHQYPCSEPLGVIWGPGRKTFLQGRECLGYERTECFVIDPDSLRTTAPFVKGLT